MGAQTRPHYPGGSKNKACRRRLRLFVLINWKGKEVANKSNVLAEVRACVSGFDNNQVIVGLRDGWGQQVPFGLGVEERRQHLYCVGKTGTGKTTLLKNLILQDIEAGEGVAVIDPHGDLAMELLDAIPSWRTDDVVFFNPADYEMPVGWNLIEAGNPDSRHLVASGIVASFKSVWSDSWGPRLEYILYAAVGALLECPNTTLLGLQRMLSDAGYRRWIVRQVKDPMVKGFWENEFESWDRKFQTEAIAPVQNKVGQLIMATPLRNIFGQVRRKVDARFMMDNGRIFIANLSKGALGEDKANLLGALLVTAFQQAAMSRTDLPEASRRDFYLYIDEFQNFSTDSFTSILSEARKYRLCLTLSHQFTDQLRPEVAEAVFGNVGTIFSFRVGETDAARLAKEFGDSYPAARFVGLPNYQVCVKPLASTERRSPFMGRTLPAFSLHSGRGPAVAKRSREKYGLRRKIVEGKIERWLAS